MRPIFITRGWMPRPSAICLRTVLNGVDSKCLAGQREEQPILAHPQAKPSSKISLELLDVALTGPSEAEQPFKDSHGSGFVEQTDVGAGLVGPINPESHAFSGRLGNRSW
jgi:hypothetical protein